MAGAGLFNGLLYDVAHGINYIWCQAAVHSCLKYIWFFISIKITHICIYIICIMNIFQTCSIFEPYLFCEYIIYNRCNICFTNLLFHGRFQFFHYCVDEQNVQRFFPSGKLQWTSFMVNSLYDVKNTFILKLCPEL